jgi:YegS/Rv2252/BmrU family lipid kinase
MLTKINIKYYYSFGALLAVLLLFTFEHLLLKLMFAWVALSLILVSSAYWLNSAGIFRKSIDGTIPWYVRWGFIPFLLSNQLYNTWARTRDTVPVIQQIDKQLYLAARLLPSDIQTLKDKNISSILDVTAEFDALDWSLIGEDVDYLNIPILDHNVPTPEQLNQAINWLHRQIKAGKTVVIHCALGRGRSVLVLAAYLVCRQREITFSEVLANISNIRKTAGLNSWQLAEVERIYAAGKIRINKRACLIANPVSGGGKWAEYAQQIEQELSGYFALEIMLTEEEVSATVLAQTARDSGADVLIACGGDGTVNQVACVLVSTDIVLGIIPLGTTNALSHTLFGISSKLIPVRKALDIIIQGNLQTIDTAKCNDDLMLLLVGLGFQQQMIKNADREQKNELGQWAYIDSLHRAINMNQTLNITMTLDDSAAVELTTHSLVIANASPVTSMLAQGNGEPDITDGLLDITWLEENDQPEEHILSFAELIMAGVGSIKIDTRVHHIQAQKIHLRSQMPIEYAIDGELFTADSLNICIKPKSLTLFMPPVEA